MSTKSTAESRSPKAQSSRSKEVAWIRRLRELIGKDCTLQFTNGEGFVRQKIVGVDDDGMFQFRFGYSDPPMEMHVSDLLYLQRTKGLD